MGKTNFPEIYKRCKAAVGGTLTIKHSAFSDMNFDASKNYAGVVVYLVDGKAQWENSSGGKVNGYRGRSFYVVISCTDRWPEDAVRDAGHGMVHHYLLKDTFGIDFRDHRIACGGFAYFRGTLRFSSAWLNACTQLGAPSDGGNYLSTGEEKLVKYIFQDWKTNGSHHISAIPVDVEKSIIGSHGRKDEQINQLAHTMAVMNIQRHIEEDTDYSDYSDHYDSFE